MGSRQHRRSAAEHRATDSARRRPRLSSGLVLLAIPALLLAACSDDQEPELTIEERLADAEGAELTTSEVAAQLALGDTLCRMDEPILDALWFRLDEDQLKYQDVVFGYICPERSVFYAGQTGRFVTQEATDSGVVTSSTRPQPTTTVTVSPTSARASIAPAPSSSLGGSTDDGTTSTPAETTPTTATPSGPASTEQGEGG